MGILIQNYYQKTSNQKISTDYYISHGSVDQVIPVDWARKASPFLDSKEIKNEYSEYPVGAWCCSSEFFQL